MEYYSAIKKNKRMPSVATWVELEILILSEVKSERVRQIPYDITYIWNLIYDTNEPIYRKNKQSHGHGEQTCGCQVGRRRSEMDWEFGLVDTISLGVHR